MKIITSGQDLQKVSTDFIELAEILTRQIENLFIYPLARQGSLRKSDLETIEEVPKVIRLIAYEAATFEKWKEGHLLEDSTN
jgi:hypothetical protein